MKALFGSRQGVCMKRAGVFLLVVALIAGMVGCTTPVEEEPIQYSLTISSTYGGTVTIPGEGKFTYAAGTVTDLVAEARAGYKFLNWTGDVDTIGDVNAASTTVTMNDDYAVTANFLRAHVYLDNMGPGAWDLHAYGEGVEARVIEEGVVVDVASDAGDYSGWLPQFGAFGSTRYVVEGDFDIRMGYVLTTWPQLSGVRVGLIVRNPVGREKAQIERTGFGAPDFPGEPREVYLVNFNETVHGITGTDDLSGTLRIRREGATVRCYYSTSEGWQEIYEAEWWMGDVEIRVGVWSHESVFGGEEVSVLLRTVEIVEPGS